MENEQAFGVLYTQITFNANKTPLKLLKVFVYDLKMHV